MASIALRLGGAALIACSLASCGGPPAAPAGRPLYSLYPLPPDPPRVQFLTQFTTVEEVTGRPRGWTGFRRWVLGPEGAEKRDELRAKKPFGVAMAKGKIYLTDSSKGRVIVYDLAQRRQYALDTRGLGKLSKPVDIFVERSTGYLFVADIGRGAIVVYDQTEQYVTSYGKPKQFAPASVFVHGNEVFVADVKGCEIEVLDRNTGELKRKFGKPGRAPGEFNAPTSIAVSEKGFLYVTDTYNFRIQKLDLDGQPLKVMGQAGDDYGSFHRPKGLTVLPSGVVCVLDAAFEAVQMFDEEGRILMHFGSPDELCLPARLAWDPDAVKYFSKYAHPDFAVEQVVLVTCNYGGQAFAAYGFGQLRDPKKAIGIEQLRPVPEGKSEVPTIPEDGVLPPPKKPQ